MLLPSRAGCNGPRICSRVRGRGGSSQFWYCSRCKKATCQPEKPHVPPLLAIDVLFKDKYPPLAVTSDDSQVFPSLSLASPFIHRISAANSPSISTLAHFAAVSNNESPPTCGSAPASSSARRPRRGLFGLIISVCYAPGRLSGPGPAKYADDV
ncbi:hypothetical protein N657DRAFT_633259 [Parathielavia appendiculata]|uniref:Uncharacterized protein n=1 Tax=Parathielavia appendiculata TaxID=2587402 RepID=A0AAN6U0D4_9PEZI|nr:hypothetical protein N657DRAFT_633259 [Parathielavia appendiculata]